ncbi:tetratricopeptide repeat protein [Rubinisphaera sp. JC750]|uniref:tetratricopeptide repeat protein n=1 Tax=Rubinisphaera sp. JC750 TaxID=2898658 RepID=UPI001F2CC3EC|nr:tetratricopeptide repeat protein [Rubinisphaera sp. JC750]
MRTYALLCLLLFTSTTSLLSEEFKVGDRVVVIEDVSIIENEKPVWNVTRGFPLDVIAVEGDRLRVKSPRSGWVPASKVVSQSEAIEYFSDLIKNDPTNREDLYARAMVWLSIDKYDEAIADFTRRIEIKQEYRDFNERGYCWMMKGEMDKAIQDFDMAVELAPKEASMRLNRGLAHQRAGNRNRALQDFSDAITLDASLTPAYENRGMIYLNNNDLKNAVRDFDVVIQRNPGSAKFRELRGRCQIALGDSAGALSDFAEILKRDPANVNAMFYQGNAHFNLGQYDKAANDYTQVLQVLPDNAVVYYQRGRTYHSSGNLAAALSDLNKAVSLDTQNVHFLRERAEILEKSGQYQDAVADFDRLLEKNPDSVPELIARANCLKMIDRSKEALRDLSRALEVAPGHQLAPLAHYIRGDLRRKAKAYTLAIEDYDQALAVQQSAEIQYWRAKCYRELGDPENAAAGLEKAIAMNPDYLEALNDLAWLQATWPLDEIRNGDQAVTHAQRACELTQWRHPLLLDTLAAAYAEAGDFESAQEQLNAAIELMSPEVQEQADVQRKAKLYANHEPFRESTLPEK